MSSNYPGALDSLNTSHADNVGEAILAATDNDEADAINNIEAELGVLPKQAWSTVRERLDALEFASFNNISTTTYTLVLTDASKFVVMLNSAASTLTVPANASVAFPAGTQIAIRSGTTAGTVSIVAAIGVTLFNPYNSLALAGQAAEARLLKIGTDAWSLNGEVA